VSPSDLLQDTHFFGGTGEEDESSLQRFERSWRRVRAARRLADLQTFEAGARQAITELEGRSRQVGRVRV